MRRTRLAVLVAAAALGGPLVMAGPAQAKSAGDCTVTPLAPVWTGRVNEQGVKLIDYRIEVTCVPDRVVDITQKRYEDDPGWWDGDDDYLGTSTFHRSFPPREGTIMVHNVRTLVDTESGAEHLYQIVKFRVCAGPDFCKETSYEGSPMTWV